MICDSSDTDGQGPCGSRQVGQFPGADRRSVAGEPIRETPAQRVPTAVATLLLSPSAASSNDGDGPVAPTRAGRLVRSRHRPFARLNCRLGVTHGNRCTVLFRAVHTVDTAYVLMCHSVPLTPEPISRPFQIRPASSMSPAPSICLRRKDSNAPYPQSLRANIVVSRDDRVCAGR